MRIIIASLIVFIIGLSCHSPEPKTPQSPQSPVSTQQIKTASTTKPLIKIEQLLSNEGYINIPLNIVEQSEKNGYLVNRIQAMSKADTLELIVHLKKDTSTELAKGTPTNNLLTDGIIFESTGPKSDRLLTALAQKYKINTGKISMKSRQVFTCLNLNKTTIDYQSGTPKFKIFLGDHGEVGELYVNFDFKKSTISLNEKDLQYRAAVINLLKQ